MLTLAIFLPSVWSQFLNWDDRDVLLQNPHFRGLGWSQLKWMFTTFHMGPYQPLTWLSFGLDYLVWGMNPLGYHLTNVLLHAANAILVYFLALELLQRASPRLALAAEFAALVFAIHPLRVESVAWVTERKDILSGLFLFLSSLLYVRTRERDRARRNRGLALSLVAFLLSLISKAVGVTLGVVLLILDIYPLRRLPGDPRRWLEASHRQVLWEKLPYLLLGIGAGWSALVDQSQAGAAASLTKYPIHFRMVQSAYGLFFYVRKTFLPFSLSPLYEVPLRFNPMEGIFVLSVVAIIAITIFLILFRSRWPAGLAAWTAYAVMVFPFLGLFQSGPQIAADRYAYVSCLPWALIVGGVKLKRAFVVAPLFGAMAMLGALTWNQQKIWHDTKSLWGYVVTQNPNSWLGHYNFGTYLEERGDLAAAGRQYEGVLKVHPYYVPAHYNLANVLAKQGRTPEAVPHYREVLRQQPSHLSAHKNFGNALLLQGKTKEAIEQYQLVLKDRPKDADTYFNLGNAFSLQKKFPQAIQAYRKAIQLNPRNPRFRRNLEAVLLRQNESTVRGMKETP